MGGTRRRLGLVVLGTAIAGAFGVASAARSAVFDVEVLCAHVRRTADPVAGVSPSGVFLLGDGRACFVGVDAGTGGEPWITDGTAAGTRRLADLRPGADSSDPVFHAALGGRVICSAGVERDLWAIDPQSGAAERLTPPGSPVDRWRFRAVCGERALLDRARWPEPSERWSTDGTAAGTVELWDQEVPQIPEQPVEPRQPPFSSVHGEFVAARHGAVFFADDGVHGVEPWVTDGTETGTRLLADLVPGPDASKPTPDGSGDLVSDGAGGAWFVAQSGDARRRFLFRTDGESVPEPVVALPDDPVATAALRADGGVVTLLDHGRRIARLSFFDPATGAEVAPSLPVRGVGGPNPVVPVAARSGDAVFVSVGGRLRVGGRTVPLPRGRRGAFAVLPVGDEGRIVYATAAGRAAEVWISDGTRRGSRPVLGGTGAPGRGVPEPWAVLGDRIVCCDDTKAPVGARLVAVPLPAAR